MAGNLPRPFERGGGGYRRVMERDEQDTTTDEAPEAPEFDPEEIENDPAYNPQDDEHLKGEKGG
jgi:hypothetical protein